MPRVIPTRVALAAIAALMLAVALITATLLATRPAAAAPRAQTALPDFLLNAKTMISVTVAVTGGQVIVVPVDLTFMAQNHRDGTDVSVLADVDQQPGIFIGVTPADAISATIQFPQAAGSGSNDTEAPASSSTANSGEGTHVANTNSNLRAGPGTNYERVGRVPRGGVVTIVGENADGTWLQLDNGNWIAEFLVDPIERNNEREPEPQNEPDNENDTENDNESDSGNDNESDSGNDNVPANNDEEEPDASDADALAAYLQDVATIDTQAMRAVDALTGLIQSAQPQSLSWRDDIAAQLSVLSAALDQYLALTPVPGYEDVHSEVTQVALTCEQAVDYLMTGLQDPSDIDPGTATQSVQACAAQASNLAAYLDTLQ